MLIRMLKEVCFDMQFFSFVYAQDLLDSSTSIKPFCFKWQNSSRFSMVHGVSRKCQFVSRDHFQTFTSDRILTPYHDIQIIKLTSDVTKSIQVISIINLLTTSFWKRSYWSRPIHRITNGDTEAPPEDNRAETRRLIEEGDEEEAGEESYRDEPTQDHLSAFNGPRVQPSRLSQTY